ncbi:Kinase, NEK [Giardia muris]|uniref:Kinase, NEK n=1 Tax=Giardia muris TaxID=5742 RepID=A0A4Z1T993_GIAMU|nr:Kinase, NEK [Giardia muris]|eukprot:TNJ29099.1 Kinase, NEK [Giardia muris]
MDGVEFASGYVRFGKIATAGTLEVYPAQKGDEAVAILTCDYSGYTDSDEHRFRNRNNEYNDYNGANTEVVSSIMSPHLARLTHYYNDDGARTLQMAIPYGYATLYDVLVERKNQSQAFPEEDICQVFSALVSALSFMHSEEKPETDYEEIPHLAVHPKNIMLHDSPNYITLGFPYLCPAASFKDGYPETFGEFGEAHYASPSFLRRDSDGHISDDIFSLGMVLYSMATLSTPFAEYDNVSSLESAYVYGVNAPYGHNYSPELMDTIMLMLKTDRTERPSIDTLKQKSFFSPFVSPLSKVSAQEPVPAVAAAHVAAPQGGMTELMVAARDGSVSEVKRLRESQAKLQDNYTWTALMYAAQNGHADCVAELLGEAGITRKDGCTALMIATFWNRVECVRLLAPLEARIVTNDNYWQGKNFTALMEAARWGRHECAEIIKMYADVAALDSKGKTAAQYASEPWEHVASDKVSSTQRVLGGQ